jgi:hypothetical protein
MRFTGTTIQLAVLLTAFVFATPGRAEPPPYLGCTATGCIGVFGSLYVSVNGDALITKPDDMNTSALQCTLVEGQYFTLKRTHVAFKEIYAMLLAATASQRPLFLRAVENTAGCELMYGVIYP